MASFFVSRVDTEIDKRLDDDRHPRGRGAAGQGAIANARLAYQRTSRSSPATAGQALAAAGANPQRPLWASTGVKDPEYPDTLYVDRAGRADTVNTMPEKTIDAVADHGVIRGNTVTGTDAQAQRGVRRPGSPRHRPGRRRSRSWRPRASTSSRSPGTNCSNGHRQLDGAKRTVDARAA